MDGLDLTAREITIPALGVAMESALLVAWLKQQGDAVEADEPVAEIETDKSTVELTSPAAGRMGPHLYEVGAAIPVGVAIAVVYDERGGPIADAAPSEAATPDTPIADGGAGAARPGAIAAAASAAGTAAAGRGEAPGAEKNVSDGRRPHRSSPRARRLAAEAGRAIAAAPAAPTGRFREIIAARVSESWRTIPHFSVVRQIDVEELGAALRERRATGGAFTLTDLLLRAHAIALMETGDPGAAGSPDVGLAVAGEHGVMIPVIRNVLGVTLAELAATRAAAVARGRNGRLAPDDLELPASTLSNLGPLAIDSFTGIIAPGQTSLVTVGRVRRVPCVLDGGIVARDVLTATINADHRALDGADVARTLGAFAAALEHPQRLKQEGPVLG